MKRLLQTSQLPFIGIFGGPLLSLLYLLFGRFQPRLRDDFAAGQPAYPLIDMLIWCVAVVGVFISLVSAVFVSRNQNNSISELRDEIEHTKGLIAQRATKTRDDFDRIERLVKECTKN